MTTPPPIQISDEMVGAYEDAERDYWANAPEPATCGEAMRTAIGAVAPLIAAQVLRGAYWKLREHASSLRATEVYRKASERREGTLGESPAHQRYRWLEATARGLESGARDIAELLDIEEYEIGDRERALMEGGPPDGSPMPGGLGS